MSDPWDTTNKRTAFEQWLVDSAAKPSNAELAAMGVELARMIVSRFPSDHDNRCPECTKQGGHYQDCLVEQARVLLQRAGEAS